MCTTLSRWLESSELWINEYCSCLRKENEDIKRAISKDNVVLLNELLKKSPDYRMDGFMDDRHSNIIHICALHNAIKCFNYLLYFYKKEIKELIDTPNANNQTPLYFIVDVFEPNEYRKFAKILIENGADKNYKCGYYNGGISPFDVVKEKLKRNQGIEQNINSCNEKLIRLFFYRNEESSSPSDDQPESS